MSDEQMWTPNPQVTRDALDRIDAAQADYPTCGLCGQRAIALDKFGLCSKVSQAHKDWRAGVRADMKVGAR
ncbi:hypothetical protein ACUOFU_16955 [Microbacterium arabinogalactanolyticum]|uniref:hypothetical protein n=1 Tax=Microbacterium arabinogalactanolyticum TaxID=69365 RepID=UPI00404449A9